jgi:hypothetical protein
MQNTTLRSIVTNRAHTYHVREFIGSFSVTRNTLAGFCSGAYARGKQGSSPARARRRKAERPDDFCIADASCEQAHTRARRIQVVPASRRDLAGDPAPLSEACCRRSG